MAWVLVVRGRGSPRACQPGRGPRGGLTAAPFSEIGPGIFDMLNGVDTQRCGFEAGFWAQRDPGGPEEGADDLGSPQDLGG